MNKPLPHLDYLFDYKVPDRLRPEISVGSLVRVPFKNETVSGFVVDLKGESDYSGAFQSVAKVLSVEPLLDERVYELAKAVARRYVGTLADVLQLAVPVGDRRKSLERTEIPAAPRVEAPERTGFGRYTAGEAFVRALGEGKAPRVVWNALPGEDWAARFAEAAAIVASRGQGALLAVPDNTDLGLLDGALTRVLGEDRHVLLTALAGPSARYRSFLAAKRGKVLVAAGTRAAVFAPVRNLGLVALWDDGDESYAERHAPYPHSREVLLTRAAREECAVLVGGYARTAQAQLLVESGWAHDMVPARGPLREALPHIAPTGDDSDLARDTSNAQARLPTAALQAMRESLADGAPVLVQVPRLGYLPAVACAKCHRRQWCSGCGGPLRLPGRGRILACGWCGHQESRWACGDCGSTEIRASVRGTDRTADELRLAFPRTEVRVSTGEERLEAAEDGIVIATPGVEPPAPHGYGAVVLIDTWAQLTRADLNAQEEALRRWMNAASLARSDGRVVVAADGAMRPVQALLRWDARWFAARECEERRELRFPPVTRMIALEGPNGEPDRVADDVVRACGDVEVLGPLPLDEKSERVLLRLEKRRTGAVVDALAEVVSRRSQPRSRRAEARAEIVKVVVDPRRIA
ncbi:primosomal protein N' family DNA-binding protein [Salininema proteolyticum]|uniref:Probable replication restart protein PriA n=1 Tax=Salininema proteolyticum TaxID=1607685 RepID=A0ABV8U033_9ACTN